jgi:nitric oxide reductase activation protein
MMARQFRYGYGGSAVDDTARRVQAARKAGVEVISIFIGELGYAEEQMVRMYGEKNKGWYPCPDAEKLPQVAEKIAASILRWEG